MTTGSLIRTVTLAAMLAASSLVTTAAVGADVSTAVVRVAASEATSRFIPLGVGKSVAIDLPEDIKDVLVADPEVANAVVRTARRVYIIGGKKEGQTNIFFFDAEGRQIAGFDIAVTRDLNGIRSAIRQALPNSDIRVEGIGAAVMLSGTATSPGDAQQAFDIATKLVGKQDAVVNSITVSGRDQVMLKVTVAEISRDVIKQLGVNLSGSFSYNVLSPASLSGLVGKTQNVFSQYGQPLNNNTSLAINTPNVSATLQAMERAGVIRTLAEPNLTAISGETATFVAGGEFPIPTGLSCDTTTSPPVCQPQIQFKKFGVSLMFTPVVLSGGRISLKVMTEVSDISTDNALPISLPNVGQNLIVPSITTRRADTVVEMPSGGSLALAGMIQDKTKQAINGVPGLMHLPILGPLFKSRDYINNRTELVVLVTPYIVHAVAPKKLSRPDDNFVDSSDPSAVLLGNFNRIYGSAGKTAPTPDSTYHGKIGFILD